MDRAQTLKPAEECKGEALELLERLSRDAQRWTETELEEHISLDTGETVLGLQLDEVLRDLAQECHSTAYLHAKRLYLDVWMRKRLDCELLTRTEARDAVLLGLYSEAGVPTEDTLPPPLMMYSPLRVHDIRLLTILSIDTEAVVCRLDTYPCWLAPEYDALSYAWGENKETTPIICNGTELPIRRSLYKAIKYLLQDRPAPVRPLWIDAICLNQDDNDEKAAHVPRMGDIYSTATRTLIWLGEEAHDDGGGGLVFVKWLAQRMEVELGSTTWHQELEQQIFLPKWKSLRELLHRPWFSRVWVVPEVILSKEVIFMCGPEFLPWSTFVAVIFTLKPLQDSVVDFSLIDIITDPAYQVKAIDILQSTFQKSKRLPLCYMMMICEKRECEDPVDRVWSFLGLVDQRLKLQIKEMGAVTYDSDSRRHYWKAYLVVMKLLFSIDQHDFWGCFVRSQGREQCSFLPSWCPDWSAPRLYRYLEGLGHRAGFSDSTLDSPPELSLSTWNACLSVDGFQVDAVRRSTAVIPDSPQNSNRQTLVLNWIWLQSCLELAGEVFAGSQDTPKKLSKTLWAVKGNVKDLEDEPIEGQPGGILTFELIRHAFEIWSQGLMADEVDIPVTGFRGLSMYPGHVVFTTVHGRIGLGPPDMKEGDKIVVFKGAQSLFILRQTDRHPPDSIEADEEEEAFENKDKFEVIGDAYVHGLMQGEAFTAKSRGVDTAFVLV